MALNINTNVAALTAHRSMLQTDNDMNTSLERLSTGLRINKAADDASGMTIADSLKSQHMGLGQGIRNANDAVSIVQTADGALEESINIVNTIKNKAIQAASDGQTADTRSAIQDDIDKLMEELDTIAKTTSYNGQQLLNGSFTNKNIQIGASSNETASIDIGSTKSTQTGHISTAQLALDNEEGGEVQLTMTSSITGEEVELESIEILLDANSAENGMGALADEINSQTYLTGISAVAVVESTTAEPVREGVIGDDFAINGVKITGVKVQDGDKDAALVTAINDKTNETGVRASREANGALKLTSTDGRAINVTGDTGGVFGNQSAADMSTIGHVTMTQAGSSQFSISGTTGGGTGDAVTLQADFTSIDDTTLAAGSTIATGSQLNAGSVVGGDAVVKVTVENTLSDYEVEKGSSLAAGTTLSQGTVVGGKVVVSGNLDTGGGSPDTTGLKQDMRVTEGSTLSAGTTLGAGTIITETFTDNNKTYQAGSTLNVDVTLVSDLIVGEDITLSANSSIAAGSTLNQGSVMGNDIEIGMTWDESVAPGAALATTTATDARIGGAGAVALADAITLAAGSTLANGSTVDLAAGNYSGPTLETDLGTIKDGDTLTGGTYTIVGDQIITDSLTTAGTGASLEEGSIIAQGSSLAGVSVAVGGYDIATLNDATMTDAMTLESGSNLAGGSVLMAGSTLGNDTMVTGEGGNDLTTYAKTELTAGSTLEANSVLAKGSVTGEGAITVDDVTLDNTMTLEAGSMLKVGTELAAGTIVGQDMSLETSGGTPVKVTAGTVLTENLLLTGDVTLSEEMTLEAKSTIKAGSELIVNTASAGNVDLTGQRSMTLSDLSVMTQEDAQIAIDIADAALKDLDKTRSGLGSVQNQLTSSIANMSVTKTNIQASESSIRDVDFAEETANYSKLQLLAQTSSYALGQANASTDTLLSLLQ